MRILGVERDETSCNHYRILQPLAKLKEAGLADTCLVAEDGTFLTQFAAQKVLEADLILIPRPATEEWFEFVKLCRRLGKTIVMDYDDDPFNTSPWNPYYRFIGVEEVEYVWPDGTREWLWQDGMKDKYGTPGFFDRERNIHRRDMFRLNFKKADLVTCTTPILQEALKKINPNTIILPNLIDLDLYPRLNLNKSGIVRIGWQGGVSHYEDLYLVRDAVIRILEKHSHVKFVYFGDYRFRHLFDKAPAGQVEFATWCPTVAYPWKLACLQLDIGLCPVVDNVFNRNKSAIKWMEYSAVGAATIASDMPPYSPVIENFRDGILVPDDTEAWFEAMDGLVQNEEKRRALAANAYEKLRELHSVEKHIHLWRDAYENLLKGSPAKV